MKPLVDFIVCGTQKGGTTALDLHLREHPEICMSKVKEVHFFDLDKHFAKGKPKYYRYHRMFEPKPQHRMVGEATPAYMYWHDSPRRMWEYNPALKLIVVLRNPIERAYSHWNMVRQKGDEGLSFWDAIQAEGERARQALPAQNRLHSYVDRGFYTEQLRRLWRYFPKQQVLVIKSESLRENAAGTLSEVCGFLGVNDFAKVDTKEAHVREYDSRMSDEERQYLRGVFEYEIKALERMLGWDCGAWFT